MSDNALCDVLEEAQLTLPTIEPAPVQPVQELTPQDQLIEALDTLIRAKLEAIVENSDYIRGVVNEIVDEAIKENFTKHLTRALEDDQEAIDAVSEIAIERVNSDYDPTDAYGFERSVESIVGDMDLSETVRRTLRDYITLTVEVS